MVENIPTAKIPSVTRIGLDRLLIPLIRGLTPGVVMDVGAKYSPYRRYVPSTRYLTLDTDPKTKPDICSDLHSIACASEYFDTVIATEVLEHLHDPGKAVSEIHRILKPGGVCIASTRFIYVYHPDPQDTYRFTWDSLRFLFKNFKKVEVFHHGNRLATIWQLLNC